MVAAAAPGLRDMRASVGEARSLAVGILRDAGVPRNAAEIQAEVLVEAELRGHPSHGLLRLPRLAERIANGVADPTARGDHHWTGEAFLVVDGQNGLGPVVALAALEAISQRARRTGIACAAIAANNHLGMLAWYVERVAAHGQVAIGLTTSEALVHPWGGRAALVGTNPIAVGVPAQPEPLVLDMATSMASAGKIHDRAIRGVPLEPGWALDAAGKPTTDPTAALAGSLAPFGGAKGHALGVTLEVLVASLTQSAMGADVVGTLDSTHASTKGDVFIVAQLPEAASASAAGAYLQTVRSSPRRDADVAVRVPGDGARRRRRRALETGFEVPDEVWATLLASRVP